MIKIKQNPQRKHRNCNYIILYADGQSLKKKQGCFQSTSLFFYIKIYLKPMDPKGEKVMRKKFISLILALTMAGALVTGCSGGSDDAAGTSAEKSGSSQSDSSDTLRISQSSGGVIDPGTGVDSASCIAYVNMYDSLVYPDMDNNPTPSLADSWEASEDGLTWTFKLKQGVKFHDGSDLKASDVVFSMNRLLTMGEGFAYLFSGYVDSCEAPADGTVVFHLKQSFAPFLSILPRLYILNEDLIMDNLEDGSYGELGDYGKAFLAENDAGSGAYHLTEMKTQDRICMSKFDDYFQKWDEKAPKNVEIVMNTETATVRTMMNSKELQISDQWQTNEAYEALDKIDGVNIGSFTNGQMLYLMLNTKKEPTDDVHVRRALAYLIDYDQVCETLFPGYKKASSVVPQGVLGYTDEGFEYKYDLKKAESELKESKYYKELTAGNLEVEVEWISDVPDEEKLALLIQSTASQIGLKIKVTKVPWATHVDKCGSVDTTPNAATCFISSDYPEAGALLYQRFHSDTAGTWQQTEWLQDQAVDDMITKALTTLDDENREASYAEIQKKAAEECWGIAVAEQVEKHAYYDNIEIPVIERAAEGKPVALSLGYNYLFRDFRMN